MERFGLFYFSMSKRVRLDSGTTKPQFMFSKRLCKEQAFFQNCGAITHHSTKSETCFSFHLKQICFRSLCMLSEVLSPSTPASSQSGLVVCPVCVCVALRWIGNLSRVYPASHP
ncbi:hypothetical protein AMECASPLE_010726 [Ameca splendens]|uniref:Uncharacterized protein n=1 Tax=Ameca splendens TaxID=208324 RepID=A0ABV1A7R3_9TELE